MELRISNLGAVESGSIDLSKKFNLLCGHNGTGKTYFAFVVFGLLRNKLLVKGDDSISDSLLNNLRASWIIDYDLLLRYRNAMRVALVEHLDDVFGLGVAECQKIFSDFNIEYGDNVDSFKSNLNAAEIDFVDTIENVNIRVKKESLSDNVHISIENETISTESVKSVRFAFMSMLLYNLCMYPIRNVAMFPVERNSIYTFSKELSIRKQEFVDRVQMMVDKDKKFDKVDFLQSSKRYPLPIKDGLMVAEDLVEKRKIKSDFFEFAEKIESELLNGKVQISNDGEIQFRPKKANGKVLPIQMSASIIKTMASLVVYLKHLAKRNDLIIIDEPEINLHPENQLILTRIFARLMNEGFRLIVSTHSDYIIREINNLVIMSHSDNAEVLALAKEHKYTENEFIHPTDLNVLVFGYKSKSSKNVNVIRQSVDDFGFDVQSIDTVIESQTGLAEKLYYALKYSSNGL